MTEPSSQIVQKFAPSNGAFLGYLSIAVFLGLAGYLVGFELSEVSLRFAIVFALVAVTVWVALIRPRAEATADTLVLRNMLHDTYIPLAQIDDVIVRQTLIVWVREAKFVCIGIGQSRKSLTGRKSRGAMSIFGLNKMDDDAVPGGEIGTSGPYHQFVEHRIDDLIRTARRDGLGEDLTVRVEWAMTELALLGALTAALVGSLVFV